MVVSKKLVPEWQWVNFAPPFLALVVVRPNGKLRISDRELGLPGAGCCFWSSRQKQL
jgi:hypothetical protein